MMGRAFAISMALNYSGVPVGAALGGWLAASDISLAVWVAIAFGCLGTVLAAVLIPMRERELELEVCRNCQRLWLDSQENIAGHLSAGAKPGPQPEAWTISASARERLADQLARRTRRRFRGDYNIIIRAVFFGLIILYIILRTWR